MVYEDVLSDAGKMDTMQKYAEGNRHVPVIVDRDNVVIGYNGKS